MSVLLRWDPRRDDPLNFWWNQRTNWHLAPRPICELFLFKDIYFLNAADRIFFLQKISSNFDILSTNKISTYPIQCIVEKLNTPQEQIIIIKALRDKIVKLSLNMYGTHVIERVMTTFDYRLLSSVSQSIIENFIYRLSSSE